ncbi:MAG: GNAT family N-acetyltransferase [Pyrinomonadaceae bacterium]
MGDQIQIRECATLDEMTACVDLQREVFALSEVELSPVRHLIVTKNAGGFTLGAYDASRLIGFVLSVPAVMRGERAFYSHMTAVHPEYQSHGVGARLKWAQRTRSLAEGVEYIKWTFEPIKARNAYFNLEKLGATVNEYAVNFYGTDYATAASARNKVGLASDRLFAEWHLRSGRVAALAEGDLAENLGAPAAEIATVADWQSMVESDPKVAVVEQLRIRQDFQAAFERKLVARGFRRVSDKPSFLLFER